MNTSLSTRNLQLPVALLRPHLHTGHGLGQGDASDIRVVARDAADLAIGLEPAGACPSGGTTVFIVLDESASITAAGGTDPLSRRHAEAARAIRHVAAACRCHRDRIALVPFDRYSAGAVTAQRLNPLGVRRLDRGLRQLANGWGSSSELGPALDHIEAQVAQQVSDVALVVFSDFLLTDASPSSVLHRLCAFPGYVHAVALGAPPPTILAAEPAIAVTRLTPSSPPGAAARAVFDGLNHYRRH